MLIFMRQNKIYPKNSKIKNNKKIKRTKIQLIQISTYTIIVYTNNKNSNHQSFYNNRRNKITQITKAIYIYRTLFSMNNYKTDCFKSLSLKSLNHFYLMKRKITLRLIPFLEKKAFL